MSKRKFSSTAVAMLGAAAISGLLAGTAGASSDMSSSRLLLNGSSPVNAFGADAAAHGAAADTATAGDKHTCKGKNSCAGHGGCKTGDNGCSGKNSCKGKGGCNTMESHPSSPAASPAAAPHVAH